MFLLLSLSGHNGSLSGYGRSHTCYELLIFCVASLEKDLVSRGFEVLPATWFDRCLFKKLAWRKHSAKQAMPGKVVHPQQLMDLNNFQNAHGGFQIPTNSSPEDLGGTQKKELLEVTDSPLLPSDQNQVGCLEQGWKTTKMTMVEHSN